MQTHVPTLTTNDVDDDDDDDDDNNTGGDYTADSDDDEKPRSGATPLSMNLTILQMALTFSFGTVEAHGRREATLGRDIVVHQPRSSPDAGTVQVQSESGLSLVDKRCKHGAGTVHVCC